MKNTNANDGGGSSGKPSEFAAETERMFQEAVDAAKVSDGDCKADGHAWRASPDERHRFCARCYDKQQSIANEDLGPVGCTRVDGHLWDQVPKYDADNMRCVVCGLEKHFRGGVWRTWMAVGGVVKVHPVKPAPDVEHEVVRRPDPPGKDPIQPDVVSKPSHYQGQDGTDVLDMLANFEILPYHFRCSAIEYIIRAGKKGNVVDEVRDLEKAVEHLCRDIEVRTGEPYTRIGRSS